MTNDATSLHQGVSSINGPNALWISVDFIDLDYRQSLDLHHSHATELRTTHYNQAMGQVVPSPRGIGFTAPSALRSRDYRPSAVAPVR